MSELFQLKWNSYESNYRAAFSNIRENKKFHDVILVTHDGHALAHRVVLSACSPVLAKILDLDSHPAPLLYFHGISITHMTTILDFMYKGEAYISSQSIDEFLAAAKVLQVEGLSNDDEDQPKGSNDKSDIASQDGTSQMDNLAVEPYLIKKQNNFDAEHNKKAKESVHCREKSSKNSIISLKNTSPAHLPTGEQVIPQEKSASLPFRIRSPKTINGCYEEIVNDEARLESQKEVKSVDLPHIKIENGAILESVKELKRKSVPNIKIENVIDSVLQQSVPVDPTTPKVRRTSPKLNDDDNFVDSDGAPIMNSFQDYDLLMRESQNPSTADSHNDDPGDQKIILTRSFEDKARFRAIVSSMIKKSILLDGIGGSYGCLVCGKQFSGKSAKTRATSHVDHIHTHYIFHKCQICDAIHKTNVALSRHMKMHKDKEAEDFEPVD